MVNVSQLFQRKVLASSISVGICVLVGAPVVFAQAPAVVEEVIVTGVRASQSTSIVLKREASSVVDSIVAEDIGKLPDATITDSLQRISGVQIRRSAGEGGALNVRGLPQVLTTLNGEAYMTAGSVTTTQPNYGDIPSSLFAGADVKKSQTATDLSGGITGTVNLKTRRPFDFDSGVTSAINAEYQTGKESSENDYGLNGLVNYRGEKIGVMLAGVYSEANLANYYSGMAGGGSDAGWSGFGSNTAGKYVQYQGHTAYNDFVARDRTGLNGVLQADLGAGLTFTGDVFYTQMDDIDRQAGVAISDKWQDWNWATPIKSRPTGAMSGEEISTVQVYNADGRRLKSYAAVKATDSESTNVSLKLDYDNGGPLTGSTRALFGQASQLQMRSYADIDMADGSQWGVKTGEYPSGTLATNPNGYTQQSLPIVVDYSASSPIWRQVPTAITGNLAGYSIGAISSEDNYDRDGDMSVFRVDGNYALNESFFTSVDAGIHFSNRSAESESFALVAPIGNNNCLVKWKATDVVMNEDSCSYGDGNGVYYTAGRPTPLANFGNDILALSDFGDVSGIGSVYVLNPAAMDNVEAFHNSLYPGNVRSVDPGRSYQVDLKENALYLQANFERDIGVAMSGNMGLRYVATDLRVVQNLVAASQPYGANAASDGDYVTNLDYTDVLPSINVAFDFTESLRLRTAYAKTMAPLDLEQWGGGLSASYSLNADTGIFEVISANSNGNPSLKPWRANNYDVSLEWYNGDSGMLSAGLFLVEIDSFIERGSVAQSLPDGDGVVRRVTNVQTNIQGEGGTLKGLELSAKQAFDFLPGILSNFGVDANFTYSPSDSGNKDLSGDDIPFADNSEQLFNFVTWYQGERLQARIAYNYRSERVVAFNQVWGTEGLTLMQAPTTYIDASISYDVLDDVTVYLNGSNITGESEDYYLQWEDQKAWQNVYEPRYTLGVRAKF